jgi:hypothetical protein
MSLVLQSSGGGQITIQEPATASNFTQNLPAVSGTIITTGNRPAGSVLQVVQGSTSTQTSTTSQTYSDTTLTASITPTSATSKILVMVNQQFRISRSSNSSFGGFRLLRGATAIVNSVSDSNGPYSNGITVTGGTFVQIYNTWSIQYLDSPATTSATTYKTQFATYDGVSSFVCQVNDSTNSSSYIQLLEIAG